MGVLFRPDVLLRAMLGVLLASVLALAAQGQNKLPVKPAAPGTGSNHRLILKDGTYQIVRKYEIAGDRVRYISVERGGEWEELPADLVDWDATRKWEQAHVEPAYADESSPAMKEAEAVDKEEADERAEEKARMPTVAKGLELPDEDSVFVLDTYEGSPELVELKPNDLAVDAKTHRGLSVLNPMAGSRASIELPGAHSKIHLHVNDPVIYLSLNVTDDAETVLSHAQTVQTSGAKPIANSKHGAHSPQSGFAIVRLDQRQAVRIVGGLKLSPAGKVTQTEDVVPTTVEVMPGKHWVKVTPSEKLLIGEYALVEIISATEIGQTVWDFNVNPTLGDNPGSIGPILKQISDR